MKIHSKNLKLVLITVLCLVAVIPALYVLYMALGAISLFSAAQDNTKQIDTDYSIMKSEFSRIKSNSELSIENIDCRNEEFAAICHVTFQAKNINDVKRAMSHSGYIVSDESSNTYSKSFEASRKSADSDEIYASIDQLTSENHNISGRFQINHLTKEQ